MAETEVVVLCRYCRRDDYDCVRQSQPFQTHLCRCVPCHRGSMLARAEELLATMGRGPAREAVTDLVAALKQFPVDDGLS
jgi:hypothetical protein